MGSCFLDEGEFRLYVAQMGLAICHLWWMDRKMFQCHLATL